MGSIDRFTVYLQNEEKAIKLTGFISKGKVLASISSPFFKEVCPAELSPEGSMIGTIFNHTEIVTDVTGGETVITDDINTITDKDAVL